MKRPSEKVQPVCVQPRVLRRIEFRMRAGG